MAIIYTYPKLETPDVLDLLLVTDVTDSNKTKQTTVKGIGDAIDVVDSITSLEPISVSSSTGDVEISLTGINGFGAAGQVLAVNQAEDALEYVTGGGGGVSLQKDGSDEVNPANTINYQNGVKVEQDSGTATTANINIVYESTLDSTSTDPVIVDKVGGFEPNTLLSQINENTNSLMWDTLLFPTIPPTYSLSTRQLLPSGIPAKEVGVSVSVNLVYSAIKNDAGAYTRLQVSRDGTELASVTSPAGTTFNGGVMQAYDPQFGIDSPNRPNLLYSENYSDTFTMPAPTGNNTSSIVSYTSKGDYDAGSPKKNSKGVDDNRTPGTTANQPQAAKTNFASPTRTVTGYYPYYYGYSSLYKTPAEFANSIMANESGGGPLNIVKEVKNADLGGNGVQLTYPPFQNLFYYLAFYNKVPVKTTWFVSLLDGADIGGQAVEGDASANNFNGPVLINLTTTNWSSVGYNIYIGANPWSIQEVNGLLQIRQ